MSEGIIMNLQKPTYETTFIVNASLEDTQIETVISHVTETITRNGGEIIAVNKWGRKRLAYTIKKKNNGYYTHIEFLAAGTVIPQLERLYQLDENILRFLTIHLDEKAIRAKEQAAIVPPAEAAPPPPDAVRQPLFEDEEEQKAIPEPK